MDEWLTARPSRTRRLWLTKHQTPNTKHQTRMQVRSLPVLQNWDCHSCGDCCRSYAVPATAEERRRIEGQGWEALPEFQGVPFFVKRGGEFYLNHRDDGG